jgi:hypothetical protein
MTVPEYREEPELTKSYLSCERVLGLGEIKPGIEELMSKIQARK